MPERECVWRFIFRQLAGAIVGASCRSDKIIFVSLPGASRVAHGKTTGPLEPSSFLEMFLSALFLQVEPNESGAFFRHKVRLACIQRLDTLQRLLQFFLIIGH